MTWMLERARDTRGFTLIEVLIVIGILGILAGIAVLGYSNFTSAADDAAQNVTDSVCEVAQNAADAFNDLLNPDPAYTAADFSDDC